MRSMLIGCAFLALGSCAALAQQDPTPAQGGSPTAPAPAAPTGAAAADPAASGAMMMKKPTVVHHAKAVTHKKTVGHAMKTNNDAITAPGGRSRLQTK